MYLLYLKLNKNSRVNKQSVIILLEKNWMTAYLVYQIHK